MFDQRPKKIINASLQLQIDLFMAEAKAKSLIAKYIFDTDNRDTFSILFKDVPPKQLIDELNKITISSNTLEKIKIVISKKDEFPALFNLPPYAWLHFLIEEQIHIEDLQALIGSNDSFEGAVSGMLDVIHEMENPVLRAWTFYYLLNYQHANENEMNVFLDSLGTKDPSFRESFVQLHRLLNNTMIYVSHDDDSISTHFVTESLLRIKKPAPPRRVGLSVEEYKITEEKYQFLQSQHDGRVHAACRLIRECISHACERTLNKLDETETLLFRHLQEQQDDCFAAQLIAEEYKEHEEKYPSPAPRRIALPSFLFEIHEVLLEEPEPVAMPHNPHNAALENKPLNEAKEGSQPSESLPRRRSF